MEENGNIYRKIELAETKIAELEELSSPGQDLVVAREELEELISIRDSMIR